MLRIQQTSHGRAVFTEQEIAPGEQILEFKGPRVHTSQLPSPYSSIEDHYLQIGPELYLGPSGDLDDFVNHSCDPNAGLHFERDQIRLIAIRPIAAGEEITFDYSTTMAEDDWEIECSCASAICRGKIQDFRHLPEQTKERYRKLGIIPPYVPTS